MRLLKAKTDVLESAMDGQGQSPHHAPLMSIVVCSSSQVLSMEQLGLNPRDIFLVKPYLKKRF